MAIPILFETVFPESKEWNDPKVLNKVRRQAVSVLYAAIMGKKIEKERLEAAKFAVGKLVATDAPKNVQVNFISWREIAEDVKKAGLLPKSHEKALPKKAQVIEAVSPKNED